MATKSCKSTKTSRTPPSRTAVESAVNRLQELGLNFLAIDFDQTILDTHTGGRWKESLEELIPYVRPEFAQLIPAAMDADIHIAVVTFTSQVSLVRGVLDYIVGIERSQQIPIRGEDRSWQYNGKGSMEGKQPHMASAVEELETNNQNLEITRKSTLLIDDDAKNVRFALMENVRAIWFNPKKPHLLLQDIMKLV